MIRSAFVVTLASLAAACSPSDEPAPEGAPSATATPAATAAPEPAATYRYTSLKGCKLLRSAPDEAGFFEHECPGEGGWRLRHVEADLRENLLLLAPGGSEHDLDLSALANGAFSSLGDNVEWRGRAGELLEPHALIVRQSVMEDPDPAVPEVSYLLAIRLAPTPCVVARIAPGPGQNEQARAAADRGGDCLRVPS